MNNQIIFNQITDNLYAYQRLQNAIDIEQAKPEPHSMGLHHASGTLLEERQILMSHYSVADMVIFRCECDPRPFWVTIEQLSDADNWIECDNCGKPCQRLLSDGTWQSEEQRQQENSRQLQ